MAGPGDRFGIAPETGGRLTKDRVLFRLGHRVEAVVVANDTAQNRLIDLQVVRDPVFYFPQSPSGGHGNRIEVTQETYFYLMVKAHETGISPPFFADRGLKIKSQGSGSVYASAIVHGIVRGEAKADKA